VSATSETCQCERETLQTRRDNPTRAVRLVSSGLALETLNLLGHLINNTDSVSRRNWFQTLIESNDLGGKWAWSSVMFLQVGRDSSRIRRI